MSEKPSVVPEDLVHLLPAVKCRRCGCEVTTQKDRLTECCYACRAKLRAIHRTISRQYKAASTEIRKFTSAVRKTDAPQTGELCEAMVNKFGGLKDFVDSWHLHIANAELGSKTALDAHVAVAKLIKDSTDIQRTTADENLTDEDIERELLSLISTQLPLAKLESELAGPLDDEDDDQWDEPDTDTDDDDEDE